MIKINDVIFDKGIIIDIIINPNVSTWCILNTILKNEDVVIIDTQGNITNKINKYKIQNVLNFTIKEAKLITSYNVFFNELTCLKKITRFVLVIDSITFLQDRHPRNMLDIIYKLWNLVYYSNCTIICFNHWKISYDTKVKFIPRMGLKYANMVSARIFVNTKYEYIVDFNNKI